MKNKLLILFSISALMLSFSIFYYLVIYSPKKSEERRLEDLAENKQKKIDEAKRYCLQQHDKIRAEAEKLILGLTKNCAYTNICTREDAVAYANGGQYDPKKDPLTQAHRDEYIKYCVAGYPIK